MARRLLSIWFPRLASDTSLRTRPLEGPFALTHRSGNADHLHCLNPSASARGLALGMALADARAICPDLATRPADLAREMRFGIERAVPLSRGHAGAPFAKTIWRAKWFCEEAVLLLTP